MCSMFWGLKLEPGKRYSTTVDKSFHISMAALDCPSVKKDGEVISVMVEEEGGAYIICNLNKESILQSHLDLNFMTGDRITLFCKGQGVVHLSGYMVPDDDDDEFPNMMDEEEEGEEEEDEEIDKVKNIKKEIQKESKSVKRSLSPEEQSPPSKKSKKMSLQKDMSDEDDDEDEEDEETDDSFGDDFELEEVEDEEDEESDEEEVEEKEEKAPVQLTKSQKRKKKKQQQQQQQQQINSSAIKQTPNKQENQKITNGAVVTPGSKKKEKKKGGEGATASPGAGKGEQQQQKKTLTSGVEIKEQRVGNGPICKQGKMVVVYYTGRLKSNNKVFDSVTQGSGFKFRLGKGEVIKGWDVGLTGMKVGGKRTITCPPQAGYGSKGAPPSIPPNSTLVFDVELKAVN